MRTRAKKTCERKKKKKRKKKGGFGKGVYGVDDVRYEAGGVGEVSADHYVVAPLPVQKYRTQYNSSVLPVQSVRFSTTAQYCSALSSTTPGQDRCRSGRCYNAAGTRISASVQHLSVSVQQYLAPYNMIWQYSFSQYWMGST
eukprot:115714-Rhodomonas_salina.1